MSKIVIPIEYFDFECLYLLQNSKGQVLSTIAAAAEASLKVAVNIAEFVSNYMFYKLFIPPPHAFLVLEPMTTLLIPSTYIL